METVSASIGVVDEEHFINIQLDDTEIGIPMSENRPTDVKSVFNKLITRLKAGLFTIALEDVGEDLFSQVAKEYISQLNGELSEVYDELLKHGLIENQPE